MEDLDCEKKLVGGFGGWEAGLAGTGIWGVGLVGLRVVGG